MLATAAEVNTSIHWEAVLITAVPAFFGMVGTIVLGAIALHQKGKLEETAVRVRSIDTAVNGTEPHQATLRENVQAVADHVLPEVKT